MKTFSLATILTFAACIYANPIPEAEVEADAAPALEKRADAYFTMWTDINFSGNTLNIKNPENLKCYTLSSPFIKTISSAGPTKNIVCTLWSQTDCKGAHYTLHNPGVGDLRNVSYNDQAVAYQCQY